MYGMEGGIPRFWYPPPPGSRPPAPLDYHTSIATGHTYGGAKGTRKFIFSFFLPMPPLPARALERGWEAPHLAHIAPLSAITPALAQP